MIRRAILDDIPEIISIAKEAYPNQPFDAAMAAAYLQACIPVKEALIMVSPGGVIVADQVLNWWNPTQPEIHIVFLAVKPGNPCAMTGYWLLENVVGWARNMGAPVHFGSATGVDLSPYARRLGAVQEAPSFRLETRGGQEGSSAAG